MPENILNDIKEALYKGDRNSVASLTKKALEDGVEIKKILNDGLISGMETIGNKFKRNEVFIPEVLIAAKAMHAGVAVIEPYFVKFGIKPIGKVAIGTVKGDLHDIGKNIVSMMFKGACFAVEDFGIDVPASRFVDAAKKGDVDIIAMSALLTTSMSAMKDTINSLKEAGLRDKVKIMVGGAPLSQEFADSVGADAYAKDAATAVDKAKELVK